MLFFLAPIVSKFKALACPSPPSRRFAICKFYDRNKNLFCSLSNNEHEPVEEDFPFAFLKENLNENKFLKGWKINGARG
jgi:hypothetical protein